MLALPRVYHWRAPVPRPEASRWKVLGLDEDPVPGNPDICVQNALMFQKKTQSWQQAYDRISHIDLQDLSGESIQAYRNRIKPLLERLSRMHEDAHAMNGILMEWSELLTDCQKRMDNVLVEAEFLNAKKEKYSSLLREAQILANEAQTVCSTVAADPGSAEWACIAARNKLAKATTCVSDMQRQAAYAQEDMKAIMHKARQIYQQYVDSGNKIARRIMNLYAYKAYSYAQNHNTTFEQATIILGFIKGEKYDIYDDEDGAKRYGGDQDGPLTLWVTGDAEIRQRIKSIIQRYHPEIKTDEVVNAYLKKLRNEGCGYVAGINTYLSQYNASEETFRKKFGFPLYRLQNGRCLLNTELMVLDFYASRDNHHHSIFGDYTWDEDGTGKDAGYGMTNNDFNYRFKSYMEEHNIKVKIETLSTPATVESYKHCIQQGKQVVLDMRPVIMTDANTGEKAIARNAGHFVTVTGVTDGGQLIVSSWGKKYYVDLNDFKSTGGEYKDFITISYEE